MWAIAKTVVAAGVLTCFCTSVWGANAQTFPTKSVRIIVGFSPGGAADTSARLVANKLTEAFGQQVIVENRSGASGLIANARVATSPPDGYTMAMVSSAASIMPALRDDLPYNVERDLAPVALVVKSAHVLLAHPSLPVRSVQDLITLARSRPDELSYGHSGFGSANHMAGELFNLMAETRIKNVAYKGGAENVTAAISGETELTLGSLVASVPFIQGGKLRALGITGPKRSPLIPDTPTISEAGLRGYESTAWYGLLAPATVPKAIIARWNTAVVQSGQTKDLSDAYARLGLDPQTYTPDQFGEYIHAEIGKNVSLVKAAGLKTAKP